MKYLFRIIKTDIYKIIHSPLLLIHLVIPILGAAIFLAYYMISPWSEVEKVMAYLQVLAMAFPFLISLITVMVAEQEQRAGSFQMLLSSPCSRFIPHFSKLIVLLILGLFSSVIAVVGFGFIFRLMGNTYFSILLYVKEAILLFIGNVILYMIQYILSFIFVKGVGLGVGIMGSLLSALMVTGLGDYIWMYIPWSLATRLCSILTVSEATNAIFTNQYGISNSLWFILITGSLLLLFFIVWSKNWEGRKNETD